MSERKKNDFSKSGSKSPNLSSHSNFIPTASLPTFKCATGWQRKSQLIRNYNVKELICQSAAAAAGKEPHGAAAKHCLESINYRALNLPGDLSDDLTFCLQAPILTPRSRSFTATVFSTLHNSSRHQPKRWNRGHKVSVTRSSIKGRVRP